MNDKLVELRDEIIALAEGVEDIYFKTDVLNEKGRVDFQSDHFDYLNGPYCVLSHENLLTNEERNDIDIIKERYDYEEEKYGYAIIREYNDVLIKRITEDDYNLNIYRNNIVKSIANDITSPFSYAKDRLQSMMKFYSNNTDYYLNRGINYTRLVATVDQINKSSQRVGRLDSPDKVEIRKSISAFIDERITKTLERKEEESKMGENKGLFYDFELEDDDKLTGGTSHEGETLAEFVAEIGLKPNKNGVFDIEEINQALYDCGIMPVKIGDGEIHSITKKEQTVKYAKERYGEDEISVKVPKSEIWSGNDKLFYALEYLRLETMVDDYDLYEYVDYPEIYIPRYMLGEFLREEWDIDEFLEEYTEDDVEDLCDFIRENYPSYDLNEHSTFKEDTECLLENIKEKLGVEISLKEDKPKKKSNGLDR